MSQGSQRDVAGKSKRGVFQLQIEPQPQAKGWCLCFFHSLGSTLPLLPYLAGLQNAATAELCAMTPEKQKELENLPAEEPRRSRLEPYRELILLWRGRAEATGAFKSCCWIDANAG